MKLDFNYDKNTHTTTCIRKFKGQQYIGVAKCHPNDYPFENKLTGEYYAYMRSVVKELQQKKYGARQQLRALKHLQNLFDQNERVSSGSKEYSLLKRQISAVEEEISFIRATIDTIKKNIISSIQEKDKLYAKLSAMRAKAMDDNSNGV